jgi:hypothetical protein
LLPQPLSLHLPAPHASAYVSVGIRQHTSATLVCVQTLSLHLQYM